MINFVILLFIFALLPTLSFHANSFINLSRFDHEIAKDGRMQNVEFEFEATLVKKSFI